MKLPQREFSPERGPALWRSHGDVFYEGIVALIIQNKREVFDTFIQTDVNPLFGWLLVRIAAVTCDAPPYERVYDPNFRGPIHLKEGSESCRLRAGMADDPTAEFSATSILVARQTMPERQTNGILFGHV